MPTGSPLDLVRDQLEALRPGQGRCAGRETLLAGDLQLGSIEVARLVGGLRRALDGAKLPFHLLFSSAKEGDLPVGRLVDFLEEHGPR